MGAKAEGEVAVVAPVGSEGVGVFEASRVAVCGAEHEEEALSRLQELAEPLVRLTDDARHGVHGPLEAEALLDGIFGAELAGNESLPGIGVGEDLPESVAEEMGGGLVAGEDDTERDVGGFARGDGVAVELGAKDGSDERAVCVDGAAGGLLVEVGAHGEDGPFSALTAVSDIERGANEEGDLVAPAFEQGRVCFGDAEEAGNDEGGEGDGEVGDEVGLPGRLEAVEEPMNDLLDGGLEPGHAAGAEGLGHHEAELHLARRVVEDHPVGEGVCDGAGIFATLPQVGCVGLDACVAEALVAQRLLDIVEAEEHPAADRRVMQQGCGFAERAQEVERRAAVCEMARVVVGKHGCKASRARRRPQGSFCGRNRVVAGAVRGLDCRRLVLGA